MSSFDDMAPNFDSASLLTCESIGSPITDMQFEERSAVEQLQRQLTSSPELKRTDSSTLTGQKRKMADTQARQDSVDGDTFTTPPLPKRDAAAPGAPKKRRYVTAYF